VFLNSAWASYYESTPKKFLESRLHSTLSFIGENNRGIFKNLTFVNISLFSVWQRCLKEGFINNITVLVNSEPEFQVFFQFWLHQKWSYGRSLPELYTCLILNIFCKILLISRLRFWNEHICFL
jgi:hypothetical protein